MTYLEDAQWEICCSWSCSGIIPCTLTGRSWTYLQEKSWHVMGYCCFPSLPNTNTLHIWCLPALKGERPPFLDILGPTEHLPMCFDWSWITANLSSPYCTNIHPTVQSTSCIFTCLLRHVCLCNPGVSTIIGTLILEKNEAWGHFAVLR